MPFATADDVAARLGRDLDAGERGSAGWLCDVGTWLIAEAASKDDAWAAALTPVPPILKALCVEVAVRAMTNPQGLRSLSETLGSYSYQQGYRDIAAGGGLMLTPVEESLVRRVVYGRTTDTAEIPSIYREAEWLRELSYLFPRGSW